MRATLQRLRHSCFFSLMKIVKKHLPLLELLAETNDAQRIAILKLMTEQQLHAGAIYMS